MAVDIVRRVITANFAVMESMELVALAALLTIRRMAGIPAKVRVPPMAQARTRVREQAAHPIGTALARTLSVPTLAAVESARSVRSAIIAMTASTTRADPVTPFGIPSTNPLSATASHIAVLTVSPDSVRPEPPSGVPLQDALRAVDVPSGSVNGSKRQRKRRRHCSRD